MQPQVDDVTTTEGSGDQDPLRVDAEGNPVFPEWDESDPKPEVHDHYVGEAGGETQVPDGEQAEWVEPGTDVAIVEEDPPEVKALIEAGGDELIAMADVEPIVSTTEASEYFDRTSQWIYWGLKPDEKTGEVIFVWPDGRPIVPERIGDPINGRRRFTTPILRAILQACYRRGNIAPEELQKVIRRIRFTELGVEWREREGWKYVDLGRNRHRWVRPEDAVYHRKSKTWKLKKRPAKPAPAPLHEADVIDVEEVSLS